MTRNLDGGGSADGDDEAEDAWTSTEQELLDAALGFYGAADGVIDYDGRERPQLRRDAAGLEAVRRAMATLEERVVVAHAAGVAPERIARIARIDAEIVTLILARDGAAPSRPED